MVFPGHSISHCNLHTGLEDSAELPNPRYMYNVHVRTCTFMYMHYSTVHEIYMYVYIYVHVHVYQYVPVLVCTDYTCWYITLVCISFPGPTRTEGIVCHMYIHA